MFGVVYVERDVGAEERGRGVAGVPGSANDCAANGSTTKAKLSKQLKMMVSVRWCAGVIGWLVNPWPFMIVLPVVVVKYYRQLADSDNAQHYYRQSYIYSEP